MRDIVKSFLFIALLGGCLSLALDGALPPAQAAQLNFTGKLVCYLKRPVVLPVAGDIISLNVQPGQKVKEGEVLGHYRLLPESVQAMRRRLLPSQITDLKARLAEIDKGINTLKNKENTLTALSRQNLAAPQSLTQIDQEIDALRKQRGILQEALEQAERTTREEEALARKQLGVSFKSGHVPKEGVLVAPIDGHVLWMHPDLRQGAQMAGGTPVLMVGVMDPMLLRAQVHEIEALKLQVGDKADITIESLPDQKFRAQVSRLPWAPPAITLEHPTYFDVEFKVENPDLILKEGLKATIQVRQPEEKNLSGISQEKAGGLKQGAGGKP
jgi:multidrug efflux pump subunit AcrA (membrane-fusion protein)